ncbi:hypothetical protein FHS18_001628 [Paenibacillus phyllosphaerae]|uniref:Uncharacterized protein n=1 Tax=Paenibacillus phyllosphaerae TaxID=274593 RepID=A0A7W5AVJ7_9BACL|nr:hypothetical protein [Paenibacillus phyllosphaerae]MBB3109565.1 hypothetical protein [Paenibacillus phyllosphaerae]
MKRLAPSFGGVWSFIPEKYKMIDKRETYPFLYFKVKRLAPSFGGV